MVGMERGEKLSGKRYMEKLSTMKKRMVVAMGWLLMALLLLPMGAMAQTTQDVKIKVTNGTTPVKGATVTIVDENGKPYKADPTGDNGVATVPGVPAPTTGTVTVEASGTFVTVTLTVDKNGKAVPSAINLGDSNIKAVQLTVMDAGTKKGIEGATVTVGVQTVTTDSKGEALLKLWVEKRPTYSVSVTANGYADATVQRRVRPSKPIPSLINISLTPVKDVTITVENNGSKVPDATVTIVDAKGKEYKTQQTTGSDGKAVVPKVLVPIAGTVTVQAKIGTEDKIVTVPVTVDKEWNVNPDRIDFKDAKEVALKVVDAKNKSGIDGVTVAVDVQEVTSKDGGKVTLNLLGGTTTGPVQYRMVAKKDGYADSTVTRTVDADGVAQPDTIKLTPVRDVTITVTENGTVVSGAAVTIVDENGKKYMKTTDPYGNAVMLKVVAPTEGTVTVGAMVDGKYTVVTAPVKVDRDGKAHPSSIDLKKLNIASVTMTVVNEWGVLITEGTVTVGVQEAQIDHGKVTLRLLGGTGVPYRMAAKGPAHDNIYADSTVTVSVKDDGTADPNTIKLKQKERVTIAVVNGPTLLPGAEVTIVDAKGNVYKVMTGSNGVADVPKMAEPTEWTVTVKTAGKEVTVPVEVDESGKVKPDKINISDPAIKAVEVTVVDAVTGKEIEGATVTVGAQTVTTDQNGKVTLNLSEGVMIQYRVVAKKSGYANRTVTREVRGYSSNLTLGTIELMSLTSVTITVVKGNSPVVGATVTIVDGDGAAHKADPTGDNGEATVGNVPVLTDGSVTVKSGSMIVTVPVKVNWRGVAEPDTIDLLNPDIVPVTVTVTNVSLVGTTWGLHAKVTVGAQEAITDDSGKATLNLLGIIGTSYQVVAKKTNGEEIRYVDSTVMRKVKMDKSNNPSLDTIKLTYLGVVTIPVVSDGSIVENGTATIVDVNGNPYTGKIVGGNAIFSKVPLPTDGTVTVKATIDGKEKTVTVPVNTGITNQKKIDLSDNVNYKMVEVTVVDAVTGKEIVGATVTVGTQTKTTDGQGKVTLKLEAGKDYSVLAKAGIYSAKTVKVSVGADGKATPDTIKLEKHHEVKFIAAGGSFKDGRRWRSVTVTYGKSIDSEHVEEVPSRVGYTFEGWYQDGENAPYDLKKPVYGSFTLTAHWEAKTYNVSFNADGGTPTPVGQTVEYGKLAKEPEPAPTKEGHTFLGWQLNGAKYDFKKPVYGSFTLTAHWEAKTYKVSFNAAGGTPVPAEQTVEYGKLAKEPEPAPTKEGHTFGGWYAGTVKYNFNDLVKGPVALTAHWEEIKVAGVTVSPAHLDLPVGGSQKLEAKVEPADAANKAVTWSVDNLAVATVDPDGTVHAVGEGEAVVTVTTADGGHTAVATVTVTRAPAAVKDVTITVTENGAGTPGATVTIVDGNGESHTTAPSTTGPDGKVVVPKVPAPTEGTVTVAAKIDGKDTVVTVPVTVDKDGNADPNTIDFKDGNIKAVKLTVVDAKTGKGIEGATVTVGAQEATADKNGQVTLSLVAGKEGYPVAAAAKGYAAGGAEVSVNADGAADPSTIKLAPDNAQQAYLNVFVVDQDLKPIEGATVVVIKKNDSKWKEECSTNAYGLATFSVDAEKVYDISVKAKGYKDASSGDVQVEKNGLDFTFVLQKDGQNNGSTTPVESELLAGVEMYPNPASVATVLHGVENAKRIAVYTVTGVQVLSLTVHGEKEMRVSAEHMAEGVYVVIVQTESGERKALKLVVRR